jgi:hypothetical protein
MPFPANPERMTRQSSLLWRNRCESEGNPGNFPGVLVGERRRFYSP